MRRMLFIFAGLSITIFLLVPVSGCANSDDSESAAGSGSGSVLEAAAEVETLPDNAGQPALNASDLPAATGTTLDYLSNTPAEPAAVSFDLEGPWDFSAGPDSSKLTIEIVDTADAPFAEEFSRAAFAANYSWDPPRGTDSFNFQSLTDTAWKSFGRSDEDGYTVYSAPVRALVFPATVGDSWLDMYMQIESDRVTVIETANRIVSYNSLTVPAGEYDAFLLQTKTTATSDGESVATWDYVWLVPGIGRAAEIVSIPGEEDELFDQAYAFYRLER